MTRLITVYALTKEQGIFRIRVPEKAPVAQLDRVPGYELGGRRFESFRARQIIKQKAATESLGSRFLFPSPMTIRFAPVCLGPRSRGIRLSALQGMKSGPLRFFR